MTRLLLCAALLAVGLMVGAPARAEEAPTTLPREEVEKIVHDYLMREPEVIYDAIQELQKRRDAAEADRQKKVIVSKHDEIFQSSMDPVAGDPKGDVTVVEFFDYHCPYCRTMVGGLRSMVQSDKRLRFVFKEFPVLGPDSIVAARAALAAKQQDPAKYYDFHVALMASRDLTEDSIKRAATQVGLDVKRLQAEMNSEPIKQAIDANRALGEELGINGTPSFIVGDKLVPGAVDVAQLAAMVGQQRSATN